MQAIDERCRNCRKRIDTSDPAVIIDDAGAWCSAVCHALEQERAEREFVREQRAPGRAARDRAFAAGFHQKLAAERTRRVQLFLLGFLLASVLAGLWP